MGNNFNQTNLKCLYNQKFTVRIKYRRPNYAATAWTYNREYAFDIPYLLYALMNLDSALLEER